MPKLGLTMESGKIVRWLVADGSEVTPGQAVLLIETDKVESEVEATLAGRLHQIGQVGGEFACGVRVGWFLAAGEQTPALPGRSSTIPDAAVGSALPGAPANGGRAAKANVGGRLRISPNARRLAAERGIDLRTVSGSGPGGRITSEDVSASSAADPAPAGPVAAVSAPVARAVMGRPATAAARNLADLLGIDVEAVAVGGPDDRVTREDVARHVRALLAEPADAPAPGAKIAPLTQTPSSVVPLSGMRGTIAKRMTESVQCGAQLTLTMDVDMDGVVVDRTLRAAEGTAPGYTDYVIAAAAQALIEHPHVNSQITDDGIALLPSVHVGLAVALDEGLIVPVVHNTAGFDLDALASETIRLATAARERKLTLNDLEGATFSVTALGMYGVDAFTPIINSPNTAILGVGRLRHDVAWSTDDSPVKATRLTLSLTWDHRAFDGVPAAEFTRSIKRRLEAYR